MLTTFNEIDMTNIMAMRTEYKDAFLEKHGVKLGFMSAFIKAASNGLTALPAVNGVIDNNEIIYRCELLYKQINKSVRDSYQADRKHPSMP